MALESFVVETGCLLLMITTGQNKMNYVKVSVFVGPSYLLNQDELFFGRLSLTYIIIIIVDF